MSTNRVRMAPESSNVLHEYTTFHTNPNDQSVNNSLSYLSAYGNNQHLQSRQQFPPHMIPPTMSVDEMNASRYGSINNYQPLLSNFNRSQMETNETGRQIICDRTMTQSPNLIVDGETSF